MGRLSSALFLISLSLYAQSLPAGFDVSTIKPSADAGDKVGIYPLPGGGLRVDGATLKSLIAFAYDVPETDITGGPKWMGSTRFDVMAKNDTLEPADDPGFSAFERLRLAVRPLLADRFRLKVRTESKMVPVYALKVAEGGVKMKPTPPDSKGPGRTMRSRSRIEAARAPTKALCAVLTNWLGRPVLDQTGLEGMFDYTLRYAPNSIGTPLPPFEGDEVADDEGPSLFVALEEQLGLKLESTRGPVPVVVVEKAELPEEN